MRVTEGALNVAVFAGPLGTTLGVQLAAVFQSPLPGSEFQTALPAKAGLVQFEQEQQRAGCKQFSDHRSRAEIVVPKEMDLADAEMILY